MKKYMMLAMSMLLLLGNVDASAVVKNPTGLPEFWVKLTIKFHRPKTMCVSGFGICFDFSVGVERPAGQAGNDACPVRMRLTERNQLILEVTEEALGNYEMGSTKPYFKGKSSITLQDPYTLSPEACRALGATGPLTIKAGTYPVAFANGIYTVTFQL